VKKHKTPLLGGLLSLIASLGVWADYKTDVGFVALKKELGTRMPTGAGVKVTQVEAATPTGWMPDPGLAEFNGKTINDLSGNSAGSYSDHATGVAQLFYGNITSMAPGIRTIDSYEASAWLNSLSTEEGSGFQNTSRIANHSWVGNGYDSTEGKDHNGDILRMVDRLVERNEYIQVVAMNNGSGNQPLLGSAYNVIAVGRTDGNHARGSYAVPGDKTYGSGRTRPDIVTPQDTTSAATPLASATAALLVQIGHRGATRLSKGWTNISGIGTVYNAERSETVKAALMAGADRQTRNTGISANIDRYRSSGNQTINGLDRRYGAGQLNILNSYHVIAAGEQNSLQDGGTGAIRASGFDYDGAFGGLGGSNRVASYFITAGSGLTLRASLVWNMRVAKNGSLSTTLCNLNLTLFDRSAKTLNPVATSNSVRDNTENLWVKLVDGHRYELRVTTPVSAKFSCDYALAWHAGR
jgi:hypothetical protein